MRPDTNIQLRSAHARHIHRALQRGFSLMELLIVLAVTMILTGLLLPALQHLRENVNRVVCSSNMRQVGMGINLFASNSNRDLLPPTAMLDPSTNTWQPQELMAAWQGAEIGWDGIGILFQQEYCGAFECFYCPSHRGDHPLEKYAAAWDRPGADPIYTNMHYVGHRDWTTKLPRYYADLESLVLLTDGIRTASDFNHVTGMNVLYGDISVRWRGDLAGLSTMLPASMGVGVEGGEQEAEDRYSTIWEQLSNSGLAK